MPARTLAPLPTVADILAELNAAASDQIRTIFLRRVPTAHILGVRYGDMAKIAKRIKVNSALACELWDTGSFEAQTLAIRAMDPADLTAELANSWVRAVDSPPVADELAALVYQTPFAAELMTAWTASPDEFVRRAGYAVLYRFAGDPQSDIDDATLLAYLDRIAAEIADSPNWAREMMNAVPVAIGKRSDALFPPALACARAFYPVAVYHGDKTNCKVRQAADDLVDPAVKIRV